MLDFEQMAGRGGRDGETKCLVLLLAEPWLYSEDIKNVKNSNGTFHSRAIKTDEAVFKYVQTRLCRRAHLANINNDNSEQGELVFFFVLMVLKLIVQQPLLSQVRTAAIP